jgi:hypothetical protein
VLYEKSKGLFTQHPLYFFKFRVFLEHSYFYYCYKKQVLPHPLFTFLTDKIFSCCDETCYPAIQPKAILFFHFHFGLYGLCL